MRMAINGEVSQKLIKTLDSLKANQTMHIGFRRSSNDLFYANYIFSLYDLEFDDDEYNEGVSFPHGDLAFIQVDVTKNANGKYLVKGTDTVAYEKIAFTVFKNASYDEVVEFLREFEGAGMPMINVVNNTMKAHRTRAPAKKPRFVCVEKMF